MKKLLTLLMLLCMVCTGAWAYILPGSYAIKVYGTNKYLNPTDWTVKGNDKMGYTTAGRPAWDVLAGTTTGVTNAISVPGSLLTLNPYHYNAATPATTVGCWIADGSNTRGTNGDAEWKIVPVEGLAGVYTIQSNNSKCLRYLSHDASSEYVLMTETTSSPACYFVFESLDPPLLTIGCVSDVHCMNNMITPSSGNLDDITVRSSLTTVLNRMKTEDNPDVLIFGGDSESDQTIAEENSNKVRQVLAEAMRSVFQEGKNPNVLWLTGNHDYEVANFPSGRTETDKPYNAGNFYEFPMKQDIGQLPESDLFYEDADNGEYGTERILAAYHYVLNGFDFVVLNCGKYFFRNAWDYTFSTESATWVQNKLQEIDPDGTKTVFFLCHVPFPDSNSLNSGKGMNTTEGYPILKEACAAHKGLIMLYGHDHGQNTAYIRENTSQRVTLYDASGNVITTTDANHVDGTTHEGVVAGGETSEEMLLSNICLKSLSGSFFGIGSSDVSVMRTPYPLKLEAFSGATNGYSLLANDGSYKINSGTNGYLSKSTNTNRPFYFYEVTSNDGSTIEAKLVEGPVAGKTYLVGLSSVHTSAHGFYVMYCNMASSTRFDVVRINDSAASNPTVPPTITLNTSTTSVATSSAIDFSKVLWQVEKVMTTGTFYVTHNDQHLIITGTNNLDLGNTETEHALTTGSESGTFNLKTTSNQYLHIGSGGLWSDGTASPLLLFDADGKRVYNVVSGQPYYIVALNGSYYAMKGAVYKDSSKQRMDTQAVTLNGDQTQMITTPGADFLWTFTDVNDPAPSTPGSAEGAETSFFSSFMGSLRYYYNAFDAADPADMPTVVQALVVKVYNDRVELHMKNYNQTGNNLNGTGINIAATPTPYTSFRTVTHSNPVEYTKVGGANIKKYTPTNRVTELQDGHNYIVYFAGLPSGQDRTGVAYERGGDQVGFYCTKKPHNGFNTTSNRFLWTVTAASDANGYYLQNVGTGKYVGSDGRANKEDANKPTVYIYPWKADGIESAGVDVESVTGTRVANASSSFENEKVWIVKNNASEYWHANIGAFTTWSSGHPVAFYEYNVEDIESVDYTINFVGTGTGTVTCGEDVLSNGQIYTSTKLLSASDITVEGCNHNVVVDDVNMTVTVTLYGLPKISTSSEKFYYTLKDTKGRNKYAYYNGNDQFLGTNSSAGNDNRYFYFTQSAAQEALSTADYKVVSIHNIAAGNKEMTAMKSWGTTETNWYIKLSPKVTDANYIAVCPNSSFGGDSWNDYSTNIQGWSANDNNSAWEFASIAAVEYTVQVQGLPSATDLAGVTVYGANYNHGAKVASVHRDAFFLAMTAMDVPGYTACVTGRSNTIRVAYTEKVKSSVAPEGDWTANTTWYYIQQKGNGYISTGSNYKDGTGFKVNQTTKPTDDNGLWAIVEDNGTYKFYNKGAGTGSVLAFTATSDNTKASLAEIASATNSNFILEPGVQAGTYSIRINGTTNARWNNRGNYLATWTSNDSFYGGGNQGQVNGGSGNGATGSQYVFEVYVPEETASLPSSWNNYSGDNQTEWAQGTSEIVTANTSNKTSHYYHDWDFQTKTHSGTVTLRFQYGSGSNGNARLDISCVEVLNADGTEVLSSDVHNGFTGDQQSNRDYTIKVPAKNTTYKLRVWTYGTRNSHGTITYMNWGDVAASEFEKATAIHDNVYPFGEHLGEYYFSNNKTTGFDEAVNACQTKDDLKDLLNTISINLPQMGKFYRLKATNNRFMCSDPEYGGPNDPEVYSLKEKAGNEKTTIFHLTDDGHLIAYATGTSVSWGWKTTLIGADHDCTWSISEAENAVSKYAIKCPTTTTWADLVYIGYNNDTHVTREGSQNNYTAWEIEEVTELPLVVGGTKFATFYTPVNVAVPSGITPYVCNLSGENLAMYTCKQTTNISGTNYVVIPAHTAVLINAKYAQTYGLTIVEDENIEEYTNNSFFGDVRTRAFDEEYTYYSLQRDNAANDGTVGFFIKPSGNFKGFQAFLKTEASQQVQRFNVTFDEDAVATGFANVLGTDNITIPAFDLSGRKVDANTHRGLYIMNGKKVIR